MNSNSIYLFGATSIVGWNLFRVARNGMVPFCNHNTKVGTCKSWRRVNLEDRDEIKAVFQRNPPHTLIHCGGICDVEKCENNPEWAYSINVESVSTLLDYLPEQTRLIYCSSDHVFGHDGRYTEYSEPSPISVYGRSKTQAEEIIQSRKAGSLIIRFGLPIGPSIDGRRGHLDWLLYRNKKALPITIIRGECRSAVWAEALSTRILAFSRSSVSGIRHVQATRTISRIQLADYLMQKLRINPAYQICDIDQLNLPHLGAIELLTVFNDELARPLPSVLPDSIQ